MPVGAFVVKMNKGVQSSLEHSRSIIALFPYPPAFKLSPTIGQLPLPDPARAASSNYTLKLQVFPGEVAESIQGELAAIGARIIKSFGDSVVIQVDRSKLADVASIDAVFHVEESMPLYMFSEETSCVMQTGKWGNGATPYTDAGVDGGGLKKTLASDGATYQDDDQILMIIDNGIEVDAGDLSDTKTSSGFDASLTNHVIAGHRKIAFYGTTNAFGGTGDLLGCDGPTTSGVTHGHTVAVVALGNASRVDLPTYDPTGDAWHATDAAGISWGLDGVAPKARLIAYDAQVTPFTGRCDDITQIPGTLGAGNSVLDPGPSLYTAPATGALADGYAKGARISNLSWGSVDPSPNDAYTNQIDKFLVDFSDAMVFVASGNTGRDKNGDRIPDRRPSARRDGKEQHLRQRFEQRGRSRRQGPRRRRWPNSSNGPASANSGRIAPLLMAPAPTPAARDWLRISLPFQPERQSRAGQLRRRRGTDLDELRIGGSRRRRASRSRLFNQGFYPDGTNTNAGNTADRVSTISGALLKRSWSRRPTG
jgi:hypothetical protein